MVASSCVGALANESAGAASSYVRPSHRAKTESTTIKSILVLLAALALVAACNDNGNSSNDAAGISSAELDTLAGKYAQLNVVAYLDEISGTDQLIVVYGFAIIQREGETLLLDEVYCHSDHLTGLPIVSVMADAATQSITPTTATLEVWRENGALRVKRPATPTPVGIWLDDPNEALPEDRNDARIWDQDQDGNPGFTVHIELKGEAGDAQVGGEVYLVRREIFAYDLIVGDDETLSGTITDTSEQLVVGASNPILEGAQSWVQKTNPDESPLVFVPVDDGLDCDGLMAERETILPLAPTLD